MSKNTNGKIRLSKVSVLHYVRLIYRSVIFIALLVFYILNKVNGETQVIDRLEGTPLLILFVWVVFILEMVYRFFPSKLESPGCQKQFACNYKKTGKTDIIIQDNNATVLVLIIWIGFNMIFGGLHMMGILDDGFMLLLCSAYSVCDVICILFFCPFQTWLLKNKCCSTCRIYNWDYAMMFTPLFFVRKSYLWALLLISFILLIRWEITFYKHSERFSENTNSFLKCENCNEKLCAHKKQLHSLWNKVEEYYETREKLLKE